MYYFAYASNLSRKQMSERCPDSQPKFTAVLPNHKLIFTGWSRKWRGGTASVKPFQGEKVAGGVYEISERDLKLLDKHEDYLVHSLAKMLNLSHRELIDAKLRVLYDQEE